MPINRADYPEDWEAVAERVKGRAKWVCQWPGCGAPHGAIVARRRDNLEQWVRCPWDADYGPEYTGPRKIIITAAHMCDCLPICGNENHIVALCQLHHLRFDTRERVISAAAERRRRERARGQGFLFADIDEPVGAGGAR